MKSVVENDTTHSANVAVKTVVVKGTNLDLKLKLTPDTNVATIKELVGEKSDLEQDNIIIRCFGKELKEDTTIGEFKGDRLLLFAKEKPPPPSPLKKRKLCVNDCGFYGDPKTNDLCSVCYKNSKTVKMTDEDFVVPDEECEGYQGSFEFDNEICEALASTSEESPNKRPVQENPERCWMCNKRIGLLGFGCKCGYKFCAIHRHSYDHNCDYDHTADDLNRLRNSNQQLKKNKIDRI